MRITTIFLILLLLSAIGMGGILVAERSGTSVWVAVPAMIGIFLVRGGIEVVLDELFPGLFTRQKKTETYIIPPKE